MVRRDPQTGEFVAEEQDAFDDIEVVSFNANTYVDAANVDGSTSGGLSEGYIAEGIEVIDYDDIVDRNERLQLLTAAHRLTAYIGSTETADGTVRAQAEVSSAPSVQMVQALGGNEDYDGTGNVVGNKRSSDTIDVLGRPMLAVGMAPFSDSASGVGGGGSAGEDEAELKNPPEIMGSFHPRDELFVNAVLEHNNVDDAAIHADVTGQHVYGVIQD